MNYDIVKLKLLEVLAEYEQRGPGFLQTGSVLTEVANRLGARRRTLEDQQLILTVWHDLFGKHGLLAWGYNLDNPGPPFLHLTAKGRSEILRQ